MVQWGVPFIHHHLENLSSVLLWGQIHKHLGAEVHSPCLPWQQRTPQGLPDDPARPPPQGFGPLQLPVTASLAGKLFSLFSMPKGKNWQ